MKLNFSRILIALSLTFFSTFIYAETTKYITELSELSPTRIMQFNHIKTLIDNGKYSHKDVISRHIATFIKNQPNFLPIYIQQVRYLTRTDWHYETKPQILWKKAELILLTTKKKDPSYFKTYDMLADVYFNQNKIKKSEVENNLALKLNPNDPWTNLHAAKIKIHFKENQKAKKIISNLLKNHYKDKRITYFIISLLKNIEQKKSTVITREIFSNLLNNTDITRDELLDVTKEVMSAFSNNNQLLYESNILIDYLFKLDKNHVPTKLMLVNYYLSLGYQYTSGLRPIYSQKVLTAAKNILLSIDRKTNLNPDVYSNLAAIFFSERNFDGMANILNEANKKRIRASSLINLGAKFFTYKQKYKKAIPMFKQLIEKDDGYATHGESGLLYIYGATGDLENTEIIHERRIKQKPSNAFNYGNYAGFLIRSKGDIDQSIKYAKKALSISNYGNARTTLATAYYAKWASLPDNAPDASTYYNKATKMQPNVNLIKTFCGKYCDQIYAKVEKRYNDMTNYKNK